MRQLVGKTGFLQESIDCLQNELLLNAPVSYLTRWTAVSDVRIVESCSCDWLCLWSAGVAANDTDVAIDAVAADVGSAKF